MGGTVEAVLLEVERLVLKKCQSFFVPFLKRAKRLMFFSRSLREKNEKRGATPRPLQRGCKLKVAETADFSCVLVSRDDAIYFLII